MTDRLGKGVIKTGEHDSRVYMYPEKDMKDKAKELGKQVETRLQGDRINDIEILFKTMDRPFSRNES